MSTYKNTEISSLSPRDSMAEIRRRKAEGRRQKTEDRGQKAEDRRYFRISIYELRFEIKGLESFVIINHEYLGHKFHRVTQILFLVFYGWTPLIHPLRI